VYTLDKNKPLYRLCKLNLKFKEKKKPHPLNKPNKKLPLKVKKKLLTLKKLLLKKTEGEEAAPQKTEGEEGVHGEEEST